MLNYITEQNLEDVMFSDTLPPDSIVIPLTEYWISYCIQTGQCAISRTALSASRSKQFLYKKIADAGLDSVRCFSNKEEAYAALEQGKKIIVKPVGLYSGLGVEVLDNSGKDMLDAYISKACAIQTKNMRLMEIENTGCMLTEYIDGAEYSADVFYYKGRISIVRVCRKKVLIIHDKPCTAVYQLVVPSEQIHTALTAWMTVLFEHDDISFAQFDFIVSPDGKAVPIDFASRIGGGLFELMSQSVTNPYADAIRGEYNLYKNTKTLTQFNYLPTVNGYIKNDAYNLTSGFCKIFKHTGDYVISNPSGIGSRVAVVIKECESDILSENIIKSLLIDEKWIEMRKKNRKEN